MEKILQRIEEVKEDKKLLPEEKKNLLNLLQRIYEQNK